AGGDDGALAQRDEVHGLVVAAVDLELHGHVLLLDEHRMADRHRGVALGGVASFADLRHDVYFSMSSESFSALGYAPWWTYCCLPCASYNTVTGRPRAPRLPARVARASTTDG